MLPYHPIVYPIPFMLSIKYKTRREVTRDLFYSLSYPGVSEVRKFSIYIVVSVCEKFPDHLVGLNGHDIAHVIAAKGEVKLSEEDVRLILRSWPDFIEAKERTASSIYSYFSEPTKSMIETWDEVTQQPEIEHAVTEGIELVDKEQFDRVVFGERIADFNRFIKLNLDRIRGNGSSSRVSG